MRIRMEFTKNEDLRFVSHLDLLKTFERAMRRAEVPLAFSEGFNPHPKIAFASALPVGVTSEKEYMDIETAVEVDTEVLKNSLNKALPPGMQISLAKPVKNKVPALMAEVNRARYRVVIGLSGPINGVELSAAVAWLMGQQQFIIAKKSKRGIRDKDIRPGILELSLSSWESEIKLDMLLQTGGEINIRPEEVVEALLNQLPENHLVYLQAQRTRLYIARDGKLYEPIEDAVL